MKMEDQSMKNGSVRSSEQVEAGYRQSRAICHYIDDAIPTLTSRAAKMIVRKPGPLMFLIGELFGIVELLAPWEEFYRNTTKPHFPFDYARLSPPVHEAYNKLLAMCGQATVASVSIQIAEAVGYKVIISNKLSRLNDIPKRSKSELGDYLIWTRPENDVRGLAGMSVRRLYERGIAHADLSEVLVLMAQYLFETGKHWDPAYITPCAVSDRFSLEHLGSSTVPCVRLCLDNHEQPEIHVGPIDINYEGSLRPIRLLGG